MWEKMAEASKTFWYCLYYLLDEDKKSPLREGEIISVPLSDDYYLEMTEKTTRIMSGGITKKYIYKRSNDEYPYIRLLDWYITEVILKES